MPQEYLLYKEQVLASQAVSVIVSSRNAANVITEQLDAIHAQLCDGDEMIVIDDASTDDTADVVRRWHRRHRDHPVTVLRARTRGGPNASRNAGTAFATRDLLAFTDGDDVVCPGWLDAMRSACEPLALLAGFYCKGGASSPYPPSRMYGFPLVLGSSMAMERRTVQVAGGFDENILRGGTESEFAVRAQAVFGMNVIPVADAVITYREPTSLKLGMIKAWSRTKGHQYIGARYRHQPSLDKSSYTLGPLMISFIKSLIRLVAPRNGIQRSTYAVSISTLPSSLFWLAVYRFRLPPESRLTTSVSRNYFVISNANDRVNSSAPITTSDLR